jgi:hypothetical protein
MRQARVRELVFDAIQESTHASEPAMFRDPRTRAIRAHEVSRAADVVDDPVVAFAPGVAERRTQPQVHAMRAQLPGEPAHDAGRVGGQEVIAGCGERDLFQAGCVQAHFVDAPHEVAWQLAEQGALGGFLHDDAGGAQFVAGVALAFEHAHAQTGLRRGQRAGGAGETCTDDDEVEPCLHARSVSVLREATMAQT